MAKEIFVLCSLHEISWNINLGVVEGGQVILEQMQDGLSQIFVTGKDNSEHPFE